MSSNSEFAEASLLWQEASRWDEVLHYNIPPPPSCASTSPSPSILICQQTTSQVKYVSKTSELHYKAEHASSIRRRRFRLRAFSLSRLLVNTSPFFPWSLLSSSPSELSLVFQHTSHPPGSPRVCLNAKQLRGCNCEQGTQAGSDGDQEPSAYHQLHSLATLQQARNRHPAILCLLRLPYLAAYETRYI